MSVLKDLARLNLPDVLMKADGTKMTCAADFEARRAEYIDLLAREEYGYLPDAPYEIEYEVVPGERLFGGGTAEQYQVKVTVKMNGGVHTFPMYCCIPVENRPCPAVLLVNFRPGIPDAYLPGEEIADNGIAAFSICYNEVTYDNDDFTDGLAGLIYQGRDRRPTDPGKISMWAWAAMRAMDYILTLDCIDAKNIAIAGHSRLGKTAMWAGVNDPRFAFIFSNESGCGGSSLARGVADDAEHVAQICNAFWYWFCENYKKYANNEDAMPFDQHYLMALTAPRRLYVGLAEGDRWTGPDSSYQGLFATAPVYDLYGCVPSFTGPDRYADSGEFFHDGYIGFHMRSGDHFLSRRDWLGFMAYMKRWLNK